MFTNAALTIYNRKINPSTRQEVWSRKVLQDIHWYTEQKVQVGEKGLQSANLYKIRIPLESFPAGYLGAEAYAALSVEEAAEHWTVSNGDLFVKGAISLDIRKPSDLAGTICGKVLSYSENFHGSSPHLRIGGA